MRSQVLSVPGFAAESSSGQPALCRPQRRSYRVLVIEDEREIAELIALHLHELPAEVKTVLGGYEGLEEARSKRYDLIVLDVRLPDHDGLEICRTLRSEEIRAPILVVSAKAGDIDRILGLELGADDYLAKPFNVAELVARAKALLRRVHYGAARNASQPEIQVSDIVIDARTRRVTVGRREVKLTAKEFELLHFLALHPGRVFTRAQLLEAVWECSYDAYEHNVNCHINRLRSKIEQQPHAPRYIVTIWSVGYKFSG